MKAVSVMMTLVVTNDSRKLMQEIEVVYEDGSTRSLTLEARKSIRVDLDLLYKEPSPPA